ncbi:MAG: pirin family protein [Fluviicola sp.]|nr:pirin family protein [Fluviicola sp.]
MDRKQFLKTSILGTSIFAASPLLARVLDNDIDELKPLEPVGFNHIPTTNSAVAENAVLHTSESRGLADHGWLVSRHTFSFANYHNPERMHFGVLRVLNDDYVAEGKGFGTHPHDNMEIISIPLSGDLQHRDSMGNIAVIKNGDVQVMSAGTGITHSEFNKNHDKAVKFLQIWVFPNKRNVTPRYDQLTLKKEERRNKLQQIVSPSPNDAGVWIHQNAWFYLSTLEQAKQVTHKLHTLENGAYIFVLSGQIKVNNQVLNTRDGYGIWNTDTLTFEATETAEFLVMEVPMVIG